MVTVDQVTGEIQEAGIVRREDPAQIAPDLRTPQQVASLLQRPFPESQIKTRPVAGGLVKYVAIGDVINRLNKACPEWNWTTTKIEYHEVPLLRTANGEKTMQMTLCAHVTGVLQIPGLGIRGAVGTAPCENNEDPAKIAESDAIKRAATMFGVPGGR